MRATRNIRICRMEVVQIAGCKKPWRCRKKEGVRGGNGVGDEGIETRRATMQQIVIEKIDGRTDEVDGDEGIGNE